MRRAGIKRDERALHRSPCVLRVVCPRSNYPGFCFRIFVRFSFACGCIISGSSFPVPLE